MQLFVYGSLAAMVAAVACALYGDKVQALFAGSGKRRFTKESAAQLAEDKRVLELQLAAALRPKPCSNCGHLAGWPTGVELADSDRSDPAPHIHAPAPVDNGIRDTPLANAETQPVDVRELREAVGEGDTQTLPVVLPVVAVEPTPRVTWGVTPVLPLQVKAGPGSADPTEVLPAVSRRAKVAVADHMGDAS
jgi:hypothetical protein